MNGHDRAIRTVSIVGARPQFIKLSPVSRAMREARRPIEDRILHTGQHYDDAMSEVFFREMDIPPPAVNLGVGSGPQGRQTARMLEDTETYLSESRPDAVLVYGDTNSTLAGALAAVKLHIPVAHVEAGLRSFNRRMPEELNRITADHLSDLLFAPTKTAVDNLAAEGLHSRAILTGDVMYDAVLLHAKAAGARSSVLRDLGTAAGEYGVLTIHRAENTTAADLRTLLGAVNRAAARFGRIIFPVHPRTAVMLRGPLSGWRPEPNLTLAEPLGYFDMLALVQGANWVLTDSGGLQKEAFFLNRPCITLRDETEWLETLEAGANRIAGRDGARLEEHLVELAHRPRSTGAAGLDRTAAIVGIAPAGEGPFGDGRAAERVVEGICALCESSQ